VKPTEEESVRHDGLGQDDNDSRSLNRMVYNVPTENGLHKGLWIVNLEATPVRLPRGNVIQSLLGHFGQCMMQLLGKVGSVEGGR
jgi:hypothetical protein